MDKEKLVALLASNNPKDPWNKNIKDSTVACYDMFKGIPFNVWLEL